MSVGRSGKAPEHLQGQNSLELVCESRSATYFRLANHAASITESITPRISAPLLSDPRIHGICTHPAKFALFVHLCADNQSIPNVGVR